MGLFSLTGDKKSTTTYSTTNTFTDQSSNAAEGAIAVGAGAKVNITDAGATKAALDANKDVSKTALDTTAQVAGMSLAANQNVSLGALAANRDVNIASLDTTSRLASHAINSVVGIGEVASRERIDLLESTNLALQNSRGASDKIADLASAALERSQTPDSAVSKQLLWVVGAVVAFLGLIFLGGRRKST